MSHSKPSTTPSASSSSTKLLFDVLSEVTEPILLHLDVSSVMQLKQLAKPFHSLLDQSFLLDTLRFLKDRQVLLLLPFENESLRSKLIAAIQPKDSYYMTSDEDGRMEDTIHGMFWDFFFSSCKAGYVGTDSFADDGQLKNGMMEGSIEVWNFPESIVEYYEEYYEDTDDGDDDDEETDDDEPTPKKRKTLPKCKALNCASKNEKPALFEIKQPQRQPTSSFFCGACLDQQFYISLQFVSQHDIGYEGNTHWTVVEQDSGECDQGQFSVGLHSHYGMGQYFYGLVVNGERDPTVTYDESKRDEEE